VHAEPEPVIRVAELADSSVNFDVRPWVNADDYWPVRSELIEQIKLAFDENGISIPFPQMDVHLNKLES
jgi:small conductance mechanosensitive channel